MKRFLYNIGRWIKMIIGTSIEHVNQGLGRFYSTEDVKGYYNDLSEKVLKDKHTKMNAVPKIDYYGSKELDFPIAIFQYGLGAYDLFLETDNDLYKKKFISCVEWAAKNQQPSGAWNNFWFSRPENPYSAMAQGEGVSLLLRAYILTRNQEYFSKAKKAIYFMVKDVKLGGTCSYENDDVVFKEVVGEPTVLNGWIFSMFGLYDFLLVSEDDFLRGIYSRSIQSLKEQISDYDVGFWSKYDENKMIASPFYHKLHINLLIALSEITREEYFLHEARKYQKYNVKFTNKCKALIIKFFQKTIRR